MDWFEVFGFITAGVCVWLQVKQIIWNWPIGIASNIVYFVVFWRSRLYADACLQVFFLSISIYGWYQWKFGGAQYSELGVRRASRSLGLSLTAATVASALGIYGLLSRFSNSDVPWGDATTTAISLTAQYMLGRKLIENWFLWIVVNVLYIGLYSYKRLYLTAFLYALFIAMCVMGYRGWQAKLDAERPLEAHAS